LMNSDSGKKVSVVKIRFNLDTPVEDSMYHYLRENYEFDKNQKQEKKKSNEESQLEIPYQEYTDVKVIPLYDFYAAAGSFSEMQSNKDYSEIKVSDKYNSTDYFACKVVGESMNKIIPNGSICLFKKYTGGSRNGKIVLVENFDFQDPDFNSAFTVKTYSSEKIINEDGWHHTAIVLRPNSYDNSFENIVITEENGAGMRVIGEFVEVIK